MRFVSYHELVVNGSKYDPVVLKHRNAYPEPKGTFESFVKALSKLLKSEIEFKEEDF